MMATKKLAPTYNEKDDQNLEDPLLKVVYDNLDEAEKKLYADIYDKQGRIAAGAYLQAIKKRLDASNTGDVPGSNQPKVTYDPNQIQDSNTYLQGAIGDVGTRVVSALTGQPVANTYRGFAGEIGGRKKEPLYFDGDESAITKLSKEELATLQNRLVKINKLTGKYRLGVADSATVQAFASLMGEANLLLTDWNTALNTLESNPQIGGKGGGLGARPDNPDDLKRIFKRASQTTLGYVLPDDKANQLVKAYQNEQVRAFTGGPAQAPQAESFFQGRIEEQMPEDAEAYKFVQYAQNFFGG
jgi:hypothetical protein